MIDKKILTSIYSILTSIFEHNLKFTDALFDHQATILLHVVQDKNIFGQHW